MKCKICGCKQGMQHKMSCPVSKYRQAPVWVPDSLWTWRSEYSDSSSCDTSSGSDSSSSSCE